MVGFVLRCIVRTLKYDPNVIETIIFNGSYAFVIVCGCIIIGIACRYPMFGRLSIAGLYRAAKLCLEAKRRVNISPFGGRAFFSSPLTSIRKLSVQTSNKLCLNMTHAPYSLFTHPLSLQLLLLPSPTFELHKTSENFKMVAAKWKANTAIIWSERVRWSERA